MPAHSAYSIQIQEAAHTNGLDPLLLEAQVLTESGGDMWAWNPEPAYPYLWDLKRHAPFRALTGPERLNGIPPADFHGLIGDPDAEWWGQKASWGLLQVMGAVARERGFMGLYLTELCRVDLNLAMGAGVMRDALAWAHGDARMALASYNGGRGAWHGPTALAYADKILALRQSWSS